MNCVKNKIELEEKGYSILNNLYSIEEISEILSCIKNVAQDRDSFMKTGDLYAIRQLIKNIPELKTHLFNKKITQLISNLSQSEYFLTKAIYFDKPSTSNWFVPYHQDLSISVENKSETENYTNWTYKKGQYGVQPPIKILQNTITIRIHLDDTNKNNGALKVIPKSHARGIINIATKDYSTDNEDICEVKKGGVMLMKPLLLHASNRTTNNIQRRVIHLEFCDQELAKPLKWLEYYNSN
ncbi:phytanoyl-CoA dioxygenase family protein [Aquimarina sp. I32.4]|uniref:phytanoyl-CoA dioxygenase family protein n=1 Tax=Aquimarina sp. I32.4 TaxID=2053903 RepID=UPI000CDEA414|nr:phytanoyl-CoA dioxygenase family protein [Aquimarina sp. I32.4]